MENEKAFTETQIKHQQEMKAKRDAVKRRKERTHRLIVRGAIAEGFIKNAEAMTDTEFYEELCRVFSIRGNSSPKPSVKSPAEGNPR